MLVRRLALVAGLFLFAAPPSAAQITVDVVDRFIAGKKAERPELDKVAAQTKELDSKIKAWRDCYSQLRDLGQVTGTSPSGFAAKAVTRAKCGATSAEGWEEERQKLLDRPEEIGAKTARMDRGEYSRYNEMFVAYLGGSRSFDPEELKVLASRASILSNVLGVALAKAESSGGGGGGMNIGGGISGMVAGAVGNAIGAQMRMFTPDMTWAYVAYLNGILYLSGATMFETDYRTGEWTRWEIKDASQPDTKTVLERAMLRRDPDRSEWWRTKTIVAGPERADTIIMESQMKPLDPEGVTMQVVRMRAKFPGDTAGKELMVPENMNTLSPSAFGRKPTKESILGATVGTDAIRVGGTTYSARHVQFGNGGGNMDWWMSDKAPGGLVKVESTARGQEGKWTMELVASGTGAKSELGMK